MYKQKLIDLLCTEPEIKEQIMELKFGCKCILYRSNGESFLDYIGEIRRSDGIGGIYDDVVFMSYQDYNSRRITFDYIEVRGIEEVEQNDIGDTDTLYLEIIGNPLEYHHLMMYCNEKTIGLITYANGLDFDNGPNINYDITKGLSNQIKKTYKEIYEFLINKI